MHRRSATQKIKKKLNYFCDFCASLRQKQSENFCIVLVVIKTVSVGG